MATAISFIVPAVPVAQPRQKHRNVETKDGRSFTQNYTPKGAPVNAFKATVRLAAQSAYSGPPLTGPLRVDCVFVFARESSKVWKTKAMPRYPHTVKPDRDNLDKAILDSLTGTIIADDASVCDGRITKWRAAGDEQPHCEVTITELSPQGAA